MNENSPTARSDTADLPQLQQLALSYAPAAARQPTLGLLLLDAHLGTLLRQMREPVLTQLRLAWWRDTLVKPASHWPQGNQVLALLAPWRNPAALVPMVDGWEELVTDDLTPAAIQGFASGRGRGFAELARQLDLPDAAQAAQDAGRVYALADLLGNISSPAEKAQILQLAGKPSPTAFRLPRPLRPLTVLAGLGARAVARGDGHLAAGGGAFALAVRLGLLGR
ncbi:hypothetical protein GRI97_13285 [Altererythrobacter xixiisoli]|uniref:Phytoene synthase n=1 Tax=Croceibacterium xixiisoli TaxID=1476466 RepID=A0A6I4TY25_9SPHN|nr:hypothetical protein [Croceibacterium xixiisoli]MXO99961.1 hypothetical protein [Croceibacterium xixiisoli]